jgi:transcription termination/antitermination protein NusG
VEVFRGCKPEDIDPDEVRRVMDRLEASKGLPKIGWQVGDEIRVFEGLFRDFKGRVVEVWPARDSLRAQLKIFGPETPVELCFDQIEKLNKE